MQNARPLVWISHGAVGSLNRLAEAEYPRETGGVLIGYWSSDSEIVVTHLVGPGPRAIHALTGFRPDQQFHTTEVARHFEQSHGVNTYLGDWHTHPGVEIAHPSGKDRATIKRIALDQEARAPKPLMLIAAGNGTRWKGRIWVGRVENWWGMWRMLRLSECVLQEY